MLAGSIYFCIRRERHHAVGLAERGPGYARRGAERQRQLDAGKGIRQDSSQRPSESDDRSTHVDSGRGGDNRGRQDMAPEQRSVITAVGRVRCHLHKV